MMDIEKIHWQDLRRAGIFVNVSYASDGTGGESIYWSKGSPITKEEAQAIWEAFVHEHSFPADDVVQANARRLIARATIGMKTYGVSMDKAKGTPTAWIDHTIEELLDAANYLEKLKRVLQ